MQVCLTASNYLQLRRYFPAGGGKRHWLLEFEVGNAEACTVFAFINTYTHTSREHCPSTPLFLVPPKILFLDIYEAERYQETRIEPCLVMSHFSDCYTSNPEQR